MEMENEKRSIVKARESQMNIDINDQSEAFQDTINQLKGHAHVFLKQINSVQEKLKENNRQIELTNIEIRKLDASVDVTIFQTIDPKLCRKLSDSEVECKVKANRPMNDREELQMLVKHVPELHAGVARYAEAIEMQTTIRDAQKETIECIERSKRIVVLEDIQIRAPNFEQFANEPFDLRTDLYSSELDNDEITSNVDDLDEDCQPFVRNSMLRSTPTNTKKTIRSDKNAKPEAVDLFADLTLTELSHKTSQLVPLNKTEMTSYKELFNPQQEVLLRNWIHIHRNGRRMKRGTWPVILKWMNENWNIQISCTQLQYWVSTKVDGFTANGMKNGEWDENEDNLLYQQYTTLHTQWSKYQIPGRSARIISYRFSTLAKAAVEKLSGKAFTTFVVESLNKLKELKVPATKSNLIMDLCETTGMESHSVIEFALNVSLAQLIRRDKIRKIDQQYETDERANWTSKLKKKPKTRSQTLRHPLNMKEELHVRSLREQCILNAKRHKHSTWLNDELIEVTTTHVGPRELAFKKADIAAGQCFKEINILINGTEQDTDKDDDEDDKDEHDEDEDDSDAVYDHRPHVFGFLRLVNSDKILFFYTAKFNVYRHIADQLSNILTLRCCPSWLAAIVTDGLSIDWDGVVLIAKADGFKAALRTKLATVNLTSSPCYNIRRQSFITISNGFAEYRQILHAANIHLNEEKI